MSNRVIGSNIIDLIDGEYKLKEDVLNYIFRDCKQTDCIALISLIGPQSEGKTFLINCFLNYLQSNDTNNWPKTENALIPWNYGFCNYNFIANKSSVQMSSNPLILEKDNQRIAVFLMDSSTIFEVSKHQIDSKVMSDMIKLFSYTSSTLVFNKSSVLTRKTRQQFAEDFEPNSEFIKAVNTSEDIMLLIRSSDLIINNREFEGENGEQNLERVLSGLKSNETVECYLIDTPVTDQVRLKWNLSQINKYYIAQLSHFMINQLFNVNNIKIKYRSDCPDQPLRKKEFIQLFKDLVKELNESKYKKFDTNEPNGSQSTSIVEQKKSTKTSVEKSNDYHSNSQNFKDHLDTIPNKLRLNQNILANLSEKLIYSQKLSSALAKSDTKHEFINELNQSNSSTEYSNQSTSGNSPDSKFEKSIENTSELEESTKQELEEYNKKLIGLYNDWVSKRIISEDFDWSLDNIFTKTKDQIISLFETKSKDCKFKKLVQYFRSKLDEHILYEDNLFTDIMAEKFKGIKAYYDLVLKNSIDYFNNNIKKGIELNIKTNNAFENLYNELYKKTKKEFENKLQKEHGRNLKKIIRTEFEVRLSYAQYLTIYQLFDRYTNECENLFANEGYFSEEKLDVIKANIYSQTPEIELKPILDQLVDKATNEYRSRLVEIKRAEEDMAESAVEYALAFYANCLQNKVKSGLYSRIDIEIIDKILMDYTLIGLKQACNFNEDQLTLIIFCEKELKSRAEVIQQKIINENQINFWNTIQLLNKTSDYLIKKYSLDMKIFISKHNYLKAKEFEELHQKIENELIVIQKERLRDTKNYFNNEFAEQVIKENEILIKNAIIKAKELFKRENDLKAPKTTTIAIHFGQQYYSSAYFDEKVEYVLDGNGCKFRPNCITFSDKFLFGSEAKNKLEQLFRQEYKYFDLTRLIGRDGIKEEELISFPFKFVVNNNHLKVEFETNSEKFQLSIESLLALQVLDIKSDAEKQLRNSVTNAVFTLPTHYNIRQRNAFRDVSKISSLESVHILSETTAAAIAYALVGNRLKTDNKSIVLLIVLNGFICEATLCDVTKKRIDFLVYSRKLLNHTKQNMGFFAPKAQNETENYRKNFNELIDDILHTIKSNIRIDFLIAGQSLLTANTKEWIAMKFGSSALFNCHPIDIIIKGSALYCQMIEKRREMIELKTKSIFRFYYWLKSHNINEKHIICERNVNLPCSYSLTKTGQASSGNLPLDLFIQENNSIVKKFNIRSFPNNPTHYWHYLNINYRIDEQGELHVNAMVISKEGDRGNAVEMTEVKLGLTDEQIKTEIVLVSKLMQIFSSNEIIIEQKSEINKALKDLEDYYFEVKKRLNNNQNLSRIKRRRIDTELDMTSELIRKESKDLKAIGEQKQRLKNTIEGLL